jgi:uncharacterized protein (TIGR01777 family)
MNTLFALLTLQAVMGAFDNLWHHEITEKLPGKRSARVELSLHAAREGLYGFLFFALAWYTWHGAWALLIAAVVIVEIIITLADFIVEDQTRRLPRAERVLHTLLAISIGAVLFALWPVLTGWFALPHGVVPTDYGALSWVFTVFGIGAAAWSLRTGIAALRHFAPPRWVREPIERAARPTGRTVLVSGATGFVGGHLVRRLLRRGDAVWVWTRDAERALDRFGPQVRIITNLAEIAADARLHAIVHLAGAPVFGMPWTAARRRKLISSRVDTAQALIDLCGRLSQPPRVWVGASAIGYYGSRGDERLAEPDAPGVGFQSQLCQSVERTAMPLAALGVRAVMLRIGLVLGDGGILPRLALPTRLGLGAVLGTGRQWVSWIHIEDLVRAIVFSIETRAVAGPVNAVAPQTLRQRHFQHLIARTLERPQWLQSPATPLRVLLGEMSELLLDGQRVYPSRLLSRGFEFQYPTARRALRSLLRPNATAPAIADANARCEVYFNGDCPVCSMEMSHYAKRLAPDSAGKPATEFVDGPKDAARVATWGLRSEHLESRLYLRNEQGRMLSGFDALLALWDRMPTYRGVARLLRAPGLHTVGVGLYDHVVAPSLTACARRRRRVALRMR